MSRPIYEPSLPRADAELGYGNRQLFRRPSPVSEDCCWGIPDLILSGGGTIIPSDTFMPVPFQDAAYPDRITLGVDYDLAITDAGDVGNDRFEVTSKIEGFYAAELLTQWDQTTTGGTVEFGYAMQRVTWTDVTGFAFSPTEYRDAADWMDADIHPEFEFVNNSYLRTWMTPLYIPPNKTWKMDAKQVTGVDRGLSGVYMKFWFIGVEDITAWTYDTV